MNDAELIAFLVSIIRNAQAEAQYGRAYETWCALYIPPRVNAAIEERM